MCCVFLLLCVSHICVLVCVLAHSRVKDPAKAQLSTVTKVVVLKKAAVQGSCAVAVVGDFVTKRPDTPA